ncbi:MAG: FAD-dependent oxidoreductase, partial [Pseudomonadota bacterium]|nr:FAD-dependent oxidoreductase [Pseudomonadota bacterium]
GAIERLARETVAHLQFGVEPDDVSTKDAFNRIPVSNLYLAPRGFGNLERGFGAGIDISLSTPVRNVHWHADAVWLHTPHGVGRARAALITA